MNLKEALLQYDIEAFQKVMEEWGVSEEEQLHYVTFIESLKKREPVAQEGTLLVEARVYEDGEDGESWEELEAFLLKNNEKYAIDFIPWEECLGYTVDEKSVETYGLEPFLFAVLYDMTFDGFEEETRNERFEEMKRRVQEVEEGVKEGHVFRSVGDLFDALHDREDT